MARSSSTGLPFLIRRPDTGKFSYWRDLPAEVAAFVTGEVSLPWSAATHTLAGRSTIKISLKSGDDAIARVRWNRVHEQVEGLVQMARILANETVVRRRRRQEVDRLPAGAVTTIAAQARHDILAEDDRTWIDPTFTSPLTEVVLGLMRKAGATSPVATAAAARRFADDLLHREAKRGLSSGWPGLVDGTIETKEFDLDPAVVDLEALQSGPLARLTPEQCAVLDAVPVTDRIRSEVDLRLAENDLALPAGHPDRRALSLALLRAKVGGLDDVKARAAGAAIETPPRPPNARPAADVPPPPGKPPVSAMRERWIKDLRPSRKQIDDNAKYIRYFIDLHGDRAVDKISPPMVAAFLDLLQRCPRNVPHGLRQASLHDRVAWAERNENRQKPRLSRGTINAKGLGSLSAVMRQAIKLGHVGTNPCVGLALLIKAGDGVKRAPYSLSDLRAIFSSSIYGEPGCSVPAGSRGADFWLPLLALFTGARLEELGQLLGSDVKTRGGILCLHLTDAPDEEASAHPAEPKKSIKTAAGHRWVPIHDELVRFGLLAFVAAQKAAGHKRLFPELPIYRGRSTKEFSRWWGRFTDRHVTSSRAKTFHSFRHLFVARLRDARIDENIIKALVGHTNTDVTIGYGQRDGFAFELPILNDALQSFRIDGLDLSHLYIQPDT